MQTEYTTNDGREIRRQVQGIRPVAKAAPTAIFEDCDRRTEGPNQPLDRTAYYDGSPASVDDFQLKTFAVTPQQLDIVRSCVRLRC
jgi:hypothetical protein